MPGAGLGTRIAAYRRRRGLSQAALAGLVGRSESWLSQVERGVRSVDRLSVLLDLARVLHVDIDALTGRPWQFAPNGSVLATGMDEVRRALTSYGGLRGTSLGELMPLEDLTGRVNETHRLYQSARYDAVIDVLPGLLATVERFPERPNGQHREALVAYVSAYVAAAKLVTKLGAADLAILAADRAATAALEADSLLARGMAGYQVVCAMLRADQVDDAERLAVELADGLTARARRDDPGQISVAGSLWLMAAVIAARKADRDEAAMRLERAARLADQLGVDGNYAWSGFGPVNVAIHRVNVAAELGDVSEALRAATLVHTERLPEGLLSRRAQVSLDLAWAQAQRRRDAEATLHLLDAERIAPQVIRHNVIAQEIVREMLARGSRRQTMALNLLAQRAGLLE